MTQATVEDYVDGVVLGDSPLPPEQHEQERRRILEMIFPTVAAAKDGVELWLYDTAQDGWFGDDGLVAIDGCMIVSIVSVQQFM
ncbi:MAG: hypothetical protein AAFQ53_07005 [Bacteroidota bacterium]